MIYLDNAATTRVCPEAAEIAYKMMTENFGNPSSTHQAGREAAAALKKARKQVADALGCMPEELYFTSCGSEADNWALRVCPGKASTSLLPQWSMTRCGSP